MKRRPVRFRTTRPSLRSRRGGSAAPRALLKIAKRRPAGRPLFEGCSLRAPRAGICDAPAVRWRRDHRGMRRTRARRRSMSRAFRSPSFHILLQTFAGLTVLTAQTLAAERGTSEWVFVGSDGKLAYKTTAKGDRIMDFSHAGYMGGGVALPDVPVKATVKPTGGEDDTAAIQAGIDQVAKRPPDQNGFRGAVLLAPGAFTCKDTLTLATSGVVLRGSGSGDGGTTIKMVGLRHGAITIGSQRGRQVDPGNEPRENSPATAPASAKTSITDAYVPAGTNAFTVANASGFAVGDRIAITRPTTKAWLHLLGMDTLKRDGKPQTFIGTNRAGVTERTITAIAGNRIMVDISLSDSYDASVLNPPGTTVANVRPTSSRVTQVGVENLRIACPPIESSYGQHPYSGIRVGGDDCWIDRKSAV